MLLSSILPVIDVVGDQQRMLNYIDFFRSSSMVAKVESDNEETHTTKYKKS